jgi:hypothetical protein
MGRLWPYCRPLLMLLMIPTHLVAHQLFREPTLHRLGGYFFGSPFDSTTAQLIVAAMCVSVAAVGARGRASSSTSRSEATGSLWLHP